MLLYDVIYARPEALSKIQLCSIEEYETLVYTEAYFMLRFAKTRDTDMIDLLCDIGYMLSDTENIWEIQELIKGNASIDYVSKYIAAAISEFAISVVDAYETIQDTDINLPNINKLIDSLL